MSTFTGTIIADTIVPATTEDTIAVAYANHVKGGHHQYATLAERDAIYPDRRQEGMLVTILAGTRTTYTLNGGITNSHWEVVPDASSVDISGKQDKSPTDGIVYGQKDGALYDLSSEFATITYVTQQLSNVITSSTLFGVVLPSDLEPVALAGTSPFAAHADHIHKFPTASDLGGTVMHKAADQAERLGLTGAHVGDQCLQEDNGKIYVLVDEPASNAGNWQELMTTASSYGVTSVNGETGAVNTVKTFSFTGDGTTTDWPITHSLGRTNIQVSFSDDTTSQSLECAWQVSGVNSISVLTAAPVSSGRKINVFIS